MVLIRYNTPHSGSALTEYRPATDWPAVEVAGLTRNPRGKIAVVGHQSLTVLSLIIFLVRLKTAADG